MKKNAYQLQDKKLLFKEVIDVLSKYDLTKINLSNLFTSPELKSCILDLLSNVFDDSIDDSLEYQRINEERIIRHYVSAKALKNPKQSGLLHVDISRMYPSIIVDLIDKDQLHFNYTHYGAMYKYLFDNAQEFKKLEDQKLHYNVRCIVNCAYMYVIFGKDNWLFSDMKTDVFSRFIQENIKPYITPETIWWYVDDIWFDESQFYSVKQMLNDPKLSIFKFHVTNVDTHDFSEDRIYPLFARHIK